MFTYFTDYIAKDREVGNLIQQLTIDKTVDLTKKVKHSHHQSCKLQILIKSATATPAFNFTSVSRNSYCISLQVQYVCMQTLRRILLMGKLFKRSLLKVVSCHIYGLLLSLLHCNYAAYFTFALCWLFILTAFFNFPPSCYDRRHYFYCIVHK